MSSVISSGRRGRFARIAIENPGKKSALDRDAMVALTGDEVATVRRLVSSEDVREGVASFLEKRDPVFRGK